MSRLLLMALIPLAACESIVDLQEVVDEIGAPVDSVTATVGFSVAVREICETPMVARGVVYSDRSSDTVLAASDWDLLIEEGVPAGCPFEGAELVSGIPSDTVFMDTIRISS